MGAIVFSGCAHFDFVNDICNDNSRCKSSISSNYSSLVFEACGGLHNGIAICEIHDGQKFKDLKIKIQTLGENSEIYFLSKNCGINENFVSKNYEKFSYETEALIQDGCVLSILLKPIYNQALKKGIVTSSLLGRIYLYKKKHNAELFLTKLGFENKKIRLKLEQNGSYKFYLSGCDFDYSQTLEIENNALEISTDDFFKDKQVGDCILHGVLIHKQSNYFKRFVWYVQKYDNNFIKLSKPSFNFRKNEIEIYADKNVSVILYNDKVFFGNFLKFNKSEDAVISMFTSSGRSLILIYKQGEFLWKD
jgi:hypothetical protein